MPSQGSNGLVYSKQVWIQLTLQELSSHDPGFFCPTTGSRLKTRANARWETEYRLSTQ
jgi:hypothetical protein